MAASPIMPIGWTLVAFVVFCAKHILLRPAAIGQNNGYFSAVPIPTLNHPNLAIDFALGVKRTFRGVFVITDIIEKVNKHVSSWK